MSKWLDPYSRRSRDRYKELCFRELIDGTTIQSCIHQSILQDNADDQLH